MSITPNHISCWNIVNPFSNKKKFTITCGGCRYVWEEKVLLNEDSNGYCRMNAICPNCRELNVWVMSTE